jgi:GT2 family glycosyltransferase
MKYTIIIPTYNHCDDLLKPCVESIFKYTDMQDVQLIISANGCTDNTKWYLDSLRYQFDSLGFGKNLKILWSDTPLGYAGANNVAIEQAVADKIVLLNNDVILLDQGVNQWLEMLNAEFDNNPQCGVSCLIKNFSPEANADFAIFFCVMISRAAFDAVGLLNTIYGAGAGEDVEFCVEAQKLGFDICQVGEKTISYDSSFWTGTVPIYHKGEGTYHDTKLFPDWNNIFYRNGLILAKKYNIEYYKRSLCNNFERAIYLKGDPVDPREVSRYQLAAQQIVGNSVLEIGCSTGFGLQFLPEHISYVGLDYDRLVIECATDQNWREASEFVHADINTYDLGYYDTIIAFEVIEHLDNGLAIVEKLKNHCRQLIISVPFMETPGFFGIYHKLHMLNESHFPGFNFSYINQDGVVLSEPGPQDAWHTNGDSCFNLMVCQYNAG